MASLIKPYDTLLYYVWDVRHDIQYISKKFILIYCLIRKTIFFAVDCMLEMKRWKTNTNILFLITQTKNI